MSGVTRSNVLLFSYFSLSGVYCWSVAKVFFRNVFVSIYLFRCRRYEYRLQDTYLPNMFFVGITAIVLYPLNKKIGDMFQKVKLGKIVCGRLLKG